MCKYIYIYIHTEMCINIFIYILWEEGMNL